jgi:RNA polymerase sigma-70 factor (ECF subfamily)
MPSDDTEFEAVVSAYYEPLYRFALGLSRSEADAADLTQRAFERFSEKSATLRDKAKVKTWLFTTLYRDFLQQKRHDTRFPHAELDESYDDKIVELPRAEISADANAAVAALNEMEEPFRSTLLLFYMNDHSYKEIADILGVPIGTVMSRLARGKEMLRAKMMEAQDDDTAARAVGKEARL